MELNEIPTPISEAARLYHFGGVVDIAVSEDLERKLAFCRDAMTFIKTNMPRGPQLNSILDSALELTKP